MTTQINIIDKMRETREASYRFMINPNNNNCINFESSPKITRFAVNDAAMHIIRMKVSLKTLKLGLSITKDDAAFIRNEDFLIKKLKEFFYGPFDSFEYTPYNCSYRFDKVIHIVADEDAEKIFEMIDEEINAACIDIVSSKNDSQYNHSSHSYLTVL